jgi:hypothetical protein
MDSRCIASRKGLHVYAPHFAIKMLSGQYAPALIRPDRQRHFKIVSLPGI